MSLLQRTIAGYAKLNIAASLVVGLGCERNQVKALVRDEALNESSALRTFTMQEVGGTRATVEAGIAAVKELLPEVNKITRQKVCASHIKVGLQCGGSDGVLSSYGESCSWGRSGYSRASWWNRNLVRNT